MRQKLSAEIPGSRLRSPRLPRSADHVWLEGDCGLTFEGAGTQGVN